MAIATNKGYLHRAFLIDASELDVSPKPVFCKNPKAIPTNAINGRLLNPRGWIESQTRANHDLFMQAYRKELFNIKQKNVLLHVAPGLCS